jgi:hypothetical protein
MGKKSSSPAMPSMDRNYQDEDDHRTLMRAAEIGNDRKRLSGARRHHKKEEKRLTLVKKQMLQGRR